MIRIAALAAIGVAVAGPMFASRGRVSRIFMVDRSRAVANMDEARDSVRRLASPADLLVEFDSAATRSSSMSALDTMRVSLARGSLSAAMTGATRAGVLAAANADSIELVLVSPLAREEFDDATPRIRLVWPGRIRVVQIRGATFASPSTDVDVGTNSQDAIVAGLSLGRRTSRDSPIRLIRDRMSAADSAWARDAGHIVLHWPAADSTAPWPRRRTIDAIGGVVASNAVLVGRFPRPWVMTGSAIARWSDGEPAAVEHETGGGCIRDVGIVIDDASDLTLSAAFRRFADALLAPCGGTRDLTVLDSATRITLAGTGPLAAGVALQDRSTESSRWSPWLFALAALLLTAELALRRSTARRSAP
jgi:hypothetical protein